MKYLFGALSPPFKFKVETLLIASGRAELRHDNILPLYGACPDAVVVSVETFPFASCTQTNLNPAIFSDEVLS